MKINRHFQQPLAKDLSWREGERKPHHRNGEVKGRLIIWQASPENNDRTEYESLSVWHGDKEMLFAARSWFETDLTPLL